MNVTLYMRTPETVVSYTAYKPHLAGCYLIGSLYNHRVKRKATLIFSLCSGRLPAWDLSNTLISDIKLDITQGLEIAEF